MVCDVSDGQQRRRGAHLMLHARPDLPRVIFARMLSSSADDCCLIASTSFCTVFMKAAKDFVQQFCARSGCRDALASSLPMQRRCPMALGNMYIVPTIVLRNSVHVFAGGMCVERSGSQGAWPP